MTVKELKKCLKGLPDDAPVYLSDHDHGYDEFNGPLFSVTIQDGDDMEDKDLHAFQKVVILSA